MDDSTAVAMAVHSRLTTGTIGQVIDAGQNALSQNRDSGAIELVDSRHALT